MLTGEAFGRGEARVLQVSSCTLELTDAVWHYAGDHEPAISAHWARQKRANPNYFNGPVWLLSKWWLDDQNAFHASVLRSDFKAYLYWRFRNFEDAGVWDGFGSGVVRSSDGGILLGQQSPGNVNAGYSYPPSGFIDDSDVAADGMAIDIERSIAREINEETGLVCADLQRQPGFWLTVLGPQISIACIYESTLTGVLLKEQVTTNLAAQDRPELAGVHIVRSGDDMRRLTVPPYGQRLLASLLAS